MTPRSEMHPASYVFGSEGIVNQTGGWNTGIAFLLGLLSVQWTVGDRTSWSQWHSIDTHALDDCEKFSIQIEWHDWPQSRQDYDATAHISYVLSRFLVINCECMSSTAKRCIELPMLHHQPFLLQVGISIPMLALLSTRITVIGTGLIGWLLSIVMILCSGPLWVNGYISIQ